MTFRISTLLLLAVIAHSIKSKNFKTNAEAKKETEIEAQVEDSVQNSDEQTSEIIFLDKIDPEKSNIKGLININSEFRIKADKNLKHLHKRNNCLSHNLDDKNKLKISRCKHKNKISEFEFFEKQDSEGFSYIASKLDGLCMTSKLDQLDQKVFMSECKAGNPDQRFEFFKDNDFFHQAMSTHRKYCLKVMPLGSLKLKICSQIGHKTTYGDGTQHMKFHDNFMKNGNFRPQVPTNVKNEL